MRMELSQLRYLKSTFLILVLLVSFFAFLEFAPKVVSGVAQTRYCRADQLTVNSITAWQLGTSYSANSTSKSLYTTTTHTTKTQYLSIKPYVVPGNGSSLVSLSNNGLVANITFTTTLTYSATWTPSQTDLDRNASILVCVWHYYSGTSWHSELNFTTEQLGSFRLEAGQWTVYYHCIRDDDGEYYYYYFYWGTSTYPSRVENFETNYYDPSATLFKSFKTAPINKTGQGGLEGADIGLTDSEMGFNLTWNNIYFKNDTGSWVEPIGDPPLECPSAFSYVWDENNNASTNSGSWANPTYAYTNDTNYATTSTEYVEHQFGGYSIFADYLSKSVKQVLVGIRGYVTIQPRDLNVCVTIDNGTTWTPYQTITLTTTEATYWVNFTSGTDWREGIKLDNNHFQIKIQAQYIVAGYEYRVNWVTVKVYYAETSDDESTWTVASYGFPCKQGFVLIHQRNNSIIQMILASEGKNLAIKCLYGTTKIPHLFNRTGEVTTGTNASDGVTLGYNQYVHFWIDTQGIFEPNTGLFKDRPPLFVNSGLTYNVNLTQIDANLTDVIQIGTGIGNVTKEIYFCIRRKWSIYSCFSTTSTEPVRVFNSTTAWGVYDSVGVVYFFFAGWRRYAASYQTYMFKGLGWGGNPAWLPPYFTDPNTVSFQAQPSLSGGAVIGFENDTGMFVIGTEACAYNTNDDRHYTSRIVYKWREVNAAEKRIDQYTWVYIRPRYSMYGKGQSGTAIQFGTWLGEDGLTPYPNPTTAGSGDSSYPNLISTVNNITGVKFTANQTGQVKRIEAYINELGIGSAKVRFAIYNASSPTIALLGSTNYALCEGSTWTYANFETNVTVISGLNYYLTVWGEKNRVELLTTSGAANQMFNYTATYQDSDGFPSTISTPTFTSNTACLFATIYSSDLQYYNQTSLSWNSWVPVLGLVGSYQYLQKNQTSTYWGGIRKHQTNLYQIMTSDTNITSVNVTSAWIANFRHGQETNEYDYYNMSVGAFYGTRIHFYSANVSGVFFTPENVTLTSSISDIDAYFVPILPPSYTFYSLLPLTFAFASYVLKGINWLSGIGLVFAFIYSMFTSFSRFVLLPLTFLFNGLFSQEIFRSFYGILPFTFSFGGTYAQAIARLFLGNIPLALTFMRESLASALFSGLIPLSHSFTSIANIMQFTQIAINWAAITPLDLFSVMSLVFGFIHGWLVSFSRFVLFLLAFAFNGYVFLQVAILTLYGLIPLIFTVVTTVSGLPIVPSLNWGIVALGFAIIAFVVAVAAFATKKD